MKIYSRHKIFGNYYYEVYNNGIMFGNGQNGSYITLKNRHGGVVVIAKRGEEFVLLDIERPFVGGRRLEFVRGFKREGETDIEAGVREVKEEIDCKVINSYCLGKLEPDSGIIENCVGVVVVEIGEGTLKGNEGEGIKKVKLVSKNELLELVRNEHIVDGYTLGALMLYLSREVFF